MINYAIAYSHANDKNLQKSLSYANYIKNQSFRWQTMGMIAEMAMSYDPKAAEALVRSELEKAGQLIANASAPQAVAPPEGAQQNNPKAAYYEMMNLYSRMLAKSGKNAEALKYASDAYQNTARKSDSMVSNYAYLMAINGNYREALPLLEKIVAAGKGNAQQKQALQTAYEKLNSGKSGSDYLAGLEKGLQAKVKEEVAKLMVNEAAPAFMVKDVNGKNVSLADYKGKIIILDFWATWCGPCKKSFPAMQMAVNKYKNDPNVKFLFIHTWEQVDDPLTDAKNYLKSNNYNFDLFMDSKNPSTKINEAVKLFGVKGIPAKFVIDGNGIIRFKLTGFSGGDDVAVQEISAMVDQIRK